MPNATRSARSGTWIDIVRADQHARDRADEQPAHRVHVDVAVEQVRDPGDPEQRAPRGRCRCRRSCCAVERIEEQHRERRRTCPSRPRSGRRRSRSSRRRATANSLVARREDERRVAAVSPRTYVLTRKPSPPMISAAPTSCCSGLRAISPNAFGDCDAEQRERRRAGQHPEREPRVDRAEHPVPRRAERLEDRAVEDVRADRDLRVEVEEQDQDRRHQRAAAHSGHPDQHARRAGPRARTARSIRVRA